MSDAKIQQMEQRQQELNSIEGRIAAAYLVDTVLNESGPSRHLPSDYSKALLDLAAASLGRMYQRQENHGLDGEIYRRSREKLRQARSDLSHANL